MKKALLGVLVCVCCAAFPCRLFAWGRVGHGIVAEIAFSFLDDNTKQAVKKCLGGTTIEQASTWMDEVRSDHSYDYMKPWHYVNIDEGSQYVATKDGNIINALNTAIEKLKNRDKLSEEDIRKNLMIIFHLVGDFHQPLHVGYGNDKGGNDVKLEYLGKQANLHWVWDTEIIESEKITPNNCLLLYRNFDKSEIAQLKEVNIEKWVQEPRSLLGSVYGFTNKNIDQAYVDKNKKVVEQQLLVAGIRLSAVLETIFK